MEHRDQFSALAREPREVRLTAQFYAWERWGRGWDVWPSSPVTLEPPFRPFLFHSAPMGVVDDGRKPTFWSTLFEARGSPPASDFDQDQFDSWIGDLATSPEPVFLARECPPAEIHVVLPETAKVAHATAEQLLLALPVTSLPLGFEIIGLSDAVLVAFACTPEDRAYTRDQLQSHFPEVILSDRDGFLAEQWAATLGAETLIAEFGLSDEFMCPLATARQFDADPLRAVIGALAGIQPAELGILQVLFVPACAPWAESVMRAVTDGEGGSFFADAPDFVRLAAEKVSQPLFGAIFRVAARSSRPGRAQEIARGMAAALRQFSRPGSNELLPLENDDYPPLAHEEDLLLRQSRRSGMLLNASELASLAHLPSASVAHPKLHRDVRRTKAAPEASRGQTLVLGENVHDGKTVPVTLATEARLRHVHVIGGTGTGKSTLLLNLIAQDMAQGRGLALLDPHGDLVDEVLARVPDSRESDVVLVDPADERPPGFNILQAHSELERTLLASDLVAVFRRLSTSWGDQMHSVLANAILAFLESERGGTLADLRRFLVESDYRTAFLQSVRDQEVRYYWSKEFPLLGGKPQAPILTRLDTFLRPKIVRVMVGAEANTIDLARIMNDGQILLVKLAQGAIGEENAALLGSLFVAKLHQLVMGRQAQRVSDRKPFFLYLDEFQHFVTPSMASLLTGARKFGLGLVLAHQELRQLLTQDRDVAAAVLANAAVRVVFRVGDDDAKRLAEGLSFFTTKDLQNLGLGEAVCRLDRAEWDFNIRTLPLGPVVPEVAEAKRERIAARSRALHGVEQVPKPRSPGEGIVHTGGWEELTPPEQPRAYPRPPVNPSFRSPAPAGVRRSPPAASVEAARPASGRGGRQHKYLQELVKRWAESKGYRATLEKPVLAGAGSVDVVLERDGETIACEICVTTPVEHEVENVAKCLAAGFGRVFIIAVERGRAAELREALRAGLTPTQHDQVQVTSPDEFFSAMEAAASARSTKSETLRGYRVKVSYGAGGSEAAARQRVVTTTVLDALRRLKSVKG